MKHVAGAGALALVLFLSGTFSTKPDDGRWSKIVFEQQKSGLIAWHLEFTSDGGESWITIWKMRMTRESGEGTCDPSTVTIPTH